MPSQHEANSLGCPHCSRLFTHKSSLVRHSKRCALGIRGPSRQKSCWNCSNAKTGCDLERPTCGRCQSRSLVCQFSNDRSVVSQSQNHESHLRRARQSHGTDRHDDASSVSNFYEPSLTPPRFDADTSPITSAHDDTEQSHTGLSYAQESETVGIAAPELLITPERRQILLGTAPGAPSLDAAVKHTTHFVTRVLKSWPRLIAVHKFTQLPPMIHRLQLEDGLPDSLANCHALASMWATHKRGSSALVQNTVLQEIKRLLDQHPTFDELDLLAAAQSLAILLIIFLFGIERPSTSPHPADAQLLLAAWDVKRRLASTGLFLEEESTHRLPPWKKWAIVSAKRRTITALHHVEWIWSITHGYPVLSCFELSPLPAPAAGYLWREMDERTWIQLYTEWLCQWSVGGGYKMLEFFQINPGGSLDERSEMWLADADEYGIMLMAEVNAVGNPD